MERESGTRAAQAVDLRLQGLRKSYGRVPAVRDVSLDVPAGTMTSLIGPSGCGKTTTLRMIAGLERADEGTIRAGERLLTDGGEATPPERRDMGMVFQSYALWPHMTVADNVAYGLKRRGVPGSRISGKVAGVLALVGMGAFGDRYPGQLSGGQQQRVALARSIATEPSILLFDEPLSNLDAVLREQMRFEIRSLQQRIGITGVYVTHSQDEALVLSDQIAVMRDGVIEQRGAPLDIYNVPRTEFVATFIGLANILSIEDVRHDAHELRGRVAGQALTASAGTQDAMRTPASNAKVCIRPVDIRLAPAAQASDSPSAAVNRLAGTVTSVTFTGGLVDYFVALDGPGDIAVRVQGTPPIAAKQGDRVIAECAAERTVVLEG
jgi:ABC-type Fe3+/spermidine/putrescine transport system ATPase subunit